MAIRIDQDSFSATRAVAPARPMAPLAAQALNAALPADVRLQSAVPVLTGDRRRRAEALTSMFENSTQTLQYAYAENLHDGRGITAGRAGFCSGTGDMVQVVRLYTAQVPNNPLARYLPRLAELEGATDNAAGSVEGLAGLENAWNTAARDPRFRAAQDQVVDTLYFRPAMARAAQAGLRSPLGQAIFYDSIIQHGNGNDPDGLPALIQRTNARLGGSPAQGVDEKQWLAGFLAVRREDLAHAYDASTRQVWAESVGRADALANVLASGNLNLDGPVHVNTEEYDFTLP